MNSVTFQSKIDGLSTIYTLEENNLGSVYFEFEDDKGAAMRLACKNASKSWELCSDKRRPTCAKKMCFGFTIETGKEGEAQISSMQQLIARVNYWMGGGNILPQAKNIPVVSIQSKDLEAQTKEMPIKSYYTNVYQMGNTAIIPAHLTDPNWNNSWR